MPSILPLQDEINHKLYSIHTHNLVVVYFLQGIFYAALPDIEHKFVQGSLRQSIFLIDQNQNRRLWDPPSIMFRPSSILNNYEIPKFLIFVYLLPVENPCQFFKFQPFKK